MKNFIKLIGIIALVAVITPGITVCAAYKTGRQEEKELNTDGRLTISGMSTCIGQEILAVFTNWDDSDLVLSLQAGESAFYNTYKGKPTGYKLIWVKPYNVIGDTIILKVYGSADDGSNPFYSYIGNDQNIELTVFSIDNDGNAMQVGTVTVNFTNGIASGAFVPDRFTGGIF